MKSKNYLLLITFFIVILMISSCSLKTDDLENATIYTTVYPVNYLTKYIYGDYGKITSIYPSNTNVDKYKLTKKQIKEYSKGDLFIYNGLTNEKQIAKNLVNRNNKLLIIDVSNGLSIEYDTIELWLSPNNFLMLSKNIKNNLEEYLKSKIIIEHINKKYDDLQEKISVLDAMLHTIGNNAKKNNKNTLIVSNNLFNFLDNYGFNVISLDPDNDIKENKLTSIKSSFKSGKYAHLLIADIDKENKDFNELTKDINATKIYVNTLTFTLEEDYFNIMTEFIENIRTITN
ncbi:MAG: zinc ABC transporter substrate-binding protein [Mollicutes bacterium]|nr:zinc ABC transporter substrate-binding protein [Mollicutes bacterium]